MPIRRMMSLAKKVGEQGEEAMGSQEERMESVWNKQEEDEVSDKDGEPEASEKITWTKTEVLSAYKKAVAVGQFKRVVYRKYPFMYNKYDLIIPRSKLLQMNYWVLAHPGENYEFWVGHGETFKLKGQAEPLKYRVFDNSVQ
jgi:hypothetical protein